MLHSEVPEPAPGDPQGPAVTAGRERGGKGGEEGTPLAEDSPVRRCAAASTGRSESAVTAPRPRGRSGHTHARAACARAFDRLQACPGPAATRALDAARDRGPGAEDRPAYGSGHRAPWPASGAADTGAGSTFLATRKQRCCDFAFAGTALHAVLEGAAVWVRA